MMSEFSSGASKPFGPSHRFLVISQPKLEVVEPSEAEDDCLQDEKWRVQDSNLHMEGSGVTIAGHGGSLLSLARPDSALTLASSAVFDEQFNEHARDAAGAMAIYEPSITNLRYPSTNPAQFDGMYNCSYRGHGLLETTIARAPGPGASGNSSDVLVVVGANSPQAEARRQAVPDPYDHLAPSTSSASPFEFLPTLSDSFDFPTSDSRPRLQLSTSILETTDHVSTSFETPLDLNLRACSNSPKPPIPEPERFRKPPARLGRGGRGETIDEANVTLGLSSHTNEANYPQAPEVVKTSSDFHLGKRQVCDSRPTADPLEHIQRERKRRDDMSAKIATLETLLPSTAKVCIPIQPDSKLWNLSF